MADKVEDGQVIGVGSGSTAYLAVLAIGERVRREKLRVTVICTSPELTLACAAVGLPVASLLQARPDWAFDGADEVDPGAESDQGPGRRDVHGEGVDVGVSAEFHSGGSVEAGAEAGLEIRHSG